MGARKDTFMERRERIRELLDSVGRWNLNIAELARTFVVTRKTIYKDLHQICKGLDPDDLKKMSFDLAVGYKKGFNECMKILATSKDEKSRISAAGQIDTMSKGIINLLESYGYLHGKACCCHPRPLASLPSILIWKVARQHHFHQHSRKPKI